MKYTWIAASLLVFSAGAVVGMSQSLPSTEASDPLEQTSPARQDHERFVEELAKLLSISRRDVNRSEVIESIFLVDFGGRGADRATVLATVREFGKKLPASLSLKVAQDERSAKIDYVDAKAGSVSMCLTFFFDGDSRLQRVGCGFMTVL